MKYLGKEPIYCTPPTKEYEDTYERVFKKGDPNDGDSESQGSKKD